ncbi:MAG: hypothetical protein ACYSWQ_21650, partial [Planctomycetota bacterium]
MRTPLLEQRNCQRPCFFSKFPVLFNLGKNICQPAQAICALSCKCHRQIGAPQTLYAYLRRIIEQSAVKLHCPLELGVRVFGFTLLGIEQPGDQTGSRIAGRKHKTFADVFCTVGVVQYEHFELADNRADRAIGGTKRTCIVEFPNDTVYGIHRLSRDDYCARVRVSPTTYGPPAVDIEPMAVMYVSRFAFGGASGVPDQ